MVDNIEIYGSKAAKGLLTSNVCLVLLVLENIKLNFAWYFGLHVMILQLSLMSWLKAFFIFSNWMIELINVLVFHVIWLLSYIMYNMRISLLKNFQFILWFDRMDQ